MNESTPPVLWLFVGKLNHCDDSGGQAFAPFDQVFSNRLLIMPSPRGVSAIEMVAS